MSLQRQLPWKLSWSCFLSAEDVRVEADGGSDDQLLWSSLSCFVRLKAIAYIISFSIMSVLVSYFVRLKAIAYIISFSIMSILVSCFVRLKAIAYIISFSIMSIL